MRKKLWDENTLCSECKNKLATATMVYREYDEKGNWTKKWVCNKCWQKNSPNSILNIMKSLSDRRTGNLDENTAQAKGDKFEELTCMWLNVENLNIKNDNYKSSIDHSRHPLLGIIQTKGKLYDSINKRWTQDWKSEWKKTFDNLVFYCANKDGSRIERVYIFPFGEIYKRSGVTIVENPSKGIQWYEQYLINEEEISKINKIWKVL